MKKLACALVAILAAALFIPAPTVSAAGLPERAAISDPAGDVRGFSPGRNSIDVLKVTGTRVGNVLIGRMRVRDVRDPHSVIGQLFVLWVQTRSGVIYHVDASGATSQAPLRGESATHFCADSAVRLNWGVETNVIVWKIPMRCFHEHPAGWRVGGIASVGSNQDAWDQTGGRIDEAKLSALFANTP